MLITYYNQEDFVEKSINSVLAINYPCEYEILVGDDGSTDGTLKRIRALEERYPKIIRVYVAERDIKQKYNPVLRASALRKKLLSMASGAYYCILDGDDWYCDTNFIIEALEVMKKRLDCSVVSFLYDEAFEQKDNSLLRRGPYPVGFQEKVVSKKKYIRRVYIHAGACVFKKYPDPIYMKMIDDCISFDDNDIVMNNLRYGEMFHVNRCIYCYRQTITSVYHAVDITKKAILNVWGCDANIFLCPGYDRYFYSRYLYSILVTLLLSRRIRKMYSYEEMQKYTEGMNKSILRTILHDNCDNDINRSFFFISIFFISIVHPRTLLKALSDSIKVKQEKD